MPDHPEAMGADGKAVYLLLWKNGSSDGSSLVRVDPKTYEQTRSEDLGPNAMGLAVRDDKIWVAVNDGLLAVDPTSLTKIKYVSANSGTRGAAANQSAAYTLGLGGESLIRVDAVTYDVTRVPLGEWSTLIANDDYVFALGESGTFRVFDPKTLARRAELSVGRQMKVRDMVFYGKKLLVTEHQDDDQGRLNIIDLQY
jgi:hypothetical protein